MKFELTVMIVVFAVSFVKAQKECKTPIREAGKCVPIDTCTVITDILRDAPKPLPPKFMAYLQKSYCDSRDNVNYVCCSERHISTTPSSSSSSSDSTEPVTKTPELIMPVDSVIEDISGHPSLRLLPQKNCGRISDNKISNGNDSSIGEFPWMALFQYETTTGLRFRCAGSLISARYVLTAAHCVRGVAEPLVSIRLGEYDTSRDIDCEDETDAETCQPAVQDIPIEEIIAHPQFNRPRFANDIAVIRLQREANMQDENIQPVCLPVTNALQNNPLTKVTIAGWGLTETKTVSNILQKAVIPVVPNEVCQQAFKRSARITASQMCAGGEKGVDSCSGDSGGPLFFTGLLDTFRYVQYGVISFGLAECGSVTTYPGIYARVSFYMKWILDQMKP